ncbi:MAG: outer membrane protein assembly factor BamE [Planctomycetales bacterium]|nr:outer membrane protein assembly factor BamE [Planctomycetales bacterium]
MIPRNTSKSEFVQPDYQKWAAVKVGMTRDEVVSLLGPPHNDKFRGGKPKRNDPYYSYGYLQMPMVPHPRTYSFLVGFDQDGVVFTKMDPFDGRFSQDGTPTTPVLITPINHSVFNHYPRIIDLRWYPSSGEYPMTYSISLAHCDRIESRWSPDHEIESELAIPFFMTEFGGAQQGRIRVKARNAFGESEWSEYRYFQFTR